VIHADDVHDPGSLIDAVDHPVSATARRMMATQLASQRLTDPMGVIK